MDEYKINKKTGEIEIPIQFYRKDYETTAIVRAQRFVRKYIKQGLTPKDVPRHIQEKIAVLYKVQERLLPKKLPRKKDMGKAPQTVSVLPGGLLGG